MTASDEEKGARAMAVEVIELAREPAVLRIQCDVSAPPSVVFACWTEPALLARWWPQQAEIEPRVGGAHHLSWPEMGWNLRGVYLAFTPAVHLSFTWRWDHDPADAPERRVDITFTPLASEATRLLLTHGPYGPTPDEQALRVESHLAGWRHFLPRLAALASSLPA